MRFRIVVLAIAAGALQSACGDSTGPVSGSLIVTTETTGADVDPDGYVLVLNDGQRSAGVTTDGTVTFAELRPGRHTVQLTEVAPNCTVAGDNPRVLGVTAGNAARTTFRVTCSANTGSLRVRTVTTGSLLDSDGYTVTLDGTTSVDIGVNETHTFDDLAPGDHSIDLSGIADNCTLNGDSSRTVTVVAESTAQSDFTATCFQVSITVLAPLDNERFVQAESVTFTAVVQMNPPAAAPEPTWSSSLDGVLGVGEALSATLSTGNHTISASVLGSTTDVPVRVYADLSGLYAAAPAQGEIDRILQDFNFYYVDTSGPDEQWAPYDDSVFDQSSTDPSNLAVLARLDVLRHQRFSVPLPIVAPNATVYEHVKTYVRDFYLYLDCRIATGGGGRVSLSRNASVWDRRQSGQPGDPDACKRPFQVPQLAPYVALNQLIVHEARHSEPSDPGHTCCGGSCGKDAQFEDGSGYAWGAMYYMWVYKYGISDAQPEKDYARSGAITILTSRFCTAPSHSDPVVQALLDELLGGG